MEIKEGYCQMCGKELERYKRMYCSSECRYINNNRYVGETLEEYNIRKAKRNGK